MEAVRVSIDPKRYDEIRPSCPQEMGDLELILKPRAMQSGDPGVMVTFNVAQQGGPVRVQACTSLRMMSAAARAMETFAHANGIDLYRDDPNELPESDERCDPDIAAAWAGLLRVYRKKSRPIALRNIPPLPAILLCKGDSGSLYFRVLVSRREAELAQKTIER